MASGTIARTMFLIIALLNQILVILGFSPLPFEDEQIVEAISISLTVFASLLAWWKNNSITKNAQTADNYLMELKYKNLKGVK